MATSNPLLKNLAFPSFDQITPEHMFPAIQTRIQECRNAIQLALTQNPSWENTVLSIEEADDGLSKTFSPIRHLHSVCNTDPIREAFDQVQPLLTEYQTEVGQNQKLYEAYLAIFNSPEFKNFSEAQKKTIQNALRDFRLSGVHLPEPQKKRLAEIANQLSELSTQFENNLIDATAAFTFSTEDTAELKGLPELTQQAALEKAKKSNQSGYLLGLDFPTYHAVMTYAENSKLRENFYQAFCTRAPNNAELIDQTLKLRQEEAEILGFKNFAELSLATKMADSPKTVLNFLYQLGEKTRPFAEKELEELAAFAGFSSPDVFKPWDVGFYSEKLRIARYALSQEDLRPYFPTEKVLQGLFTLISRLFGVNFSQSEAPTWHPDVRFFELKKSKASSSLSTIGYLYLDLYAREAKREGAWMDECHERRKKLDGSLQLPIAYLTCNFMPGLENKPAYLTHDDVVTLFHELGHCLHHLLTQIDISAVSGINGVPWDAVELPSQFLENFAWQWDVISELSAHEATGEPLPKQLFDQLLKTKNFQSGLFMMRQLEFSIFDFELHCHNQKPHPQVQTILDQVRERYTLIKTPSYNRFQQSFSHIFAGGYAAGYYSYKWAEVLSADAFSRFEEEGLFNASVGQAFLDEILSVGGSRDPIEMFKAFRGREPAIDALLTHSGLI